MRNLRCYYHATIEEFLRQPTAEIVGVIHSNDISAETRIQQSNTWEQEIEILKSQLAELDEGEILFEYSIPRMGKRVDNVVLYHNIVFLLEFKCGDREYRSTTYDQVYDYALDLRNFQKESHDKLLIPMMVSTNAPEFENRLVEIERIIEPMRCNAHNIGSTIMNRILTIRNGFFPNISRRRRLSRLLRRFTAATMLRTSRAATQVLRI